jgi:alginate O-acetyltransferase complex protein AlgI
LLFNSPQFFVFFPVVTLIYFVLPYRYRWPWLLLASCYFYMAFIPVFILILCFTIAIDYPSGILIEGATDRRRKTFLIISLAANIGVLALFKYYNFFNHTLADLASALGLTYTIPNLGIILPIGLSFHTFQSMAYTIEVYKGRQKAEHNLGILALYVMFYPQLVAGPIERPQNLLHQFREHYDFEYSRVVDGLRLMLWGFFKKVVIADRLALLVNPIYNHPTSYPGPLLLLATFFFTYQIYCDFSGYSDIAIGAARVMGFRLMQNFDRPYYSHSISEFWRRWHISLSSWFRDYLYIPLGGSRAQPWRVSLNLLITFLISGLWHGANWTFVVWGGLHGCYQIVSYLTRTSRGHLVEVLRINQLSWLYRSIQILITFSLVSFAWIFFRANQLSDAIYISTHLFSGYDMANLNLIAEEIRVNLGQSMQLKILFPDLTGFTILAIAITLIAITETIQLTLHRSFFDLSGRPAWLRWSVYYGLIMLILLFGVFAQSQFIYFQF